jgi:hypothetical protein
VRARGAHASIGQCRQIAAGRCRQAGPVARSREQEAGDHGGGKAEHHFVRVPGHTGQVPGLRQHTVPLRQPHWNIHRRQQCGEQIERAESEVE